MPFAQGSRTRLAIGAQSNFTTDAAAMTQVDFVTHDLDLSKERVQGQSIQSDRAPRVDRHGNRQVGGTINVEMRDTDYDLLLQSLLFSSFATDGTMENGVTESFLTIEDGALDIAQYRKFQGCAVNTLQLSAQPNQMITGAFGIVGRDMVQSGSQLATPSAASGGEPWDSYSGAIYEGGTATADLIAVLSGIELNINNSYGPTFVLGSAVTPQLEFGRMEITGNLTAYYEDADLINKFINETESSLQVTFDDPATGGAYTFSLPRIKINGAAVPVGNPQSRLITLPIVALHSTAAGHMIQITKT